jgi:UDP-glucose 4-epimerase
MKYCVTGSAGFIGSHMMKRLMPDAFGIDKVGGKYADLSEKFDPKIVQCETIFHFAASPDVRASMHNPQEAIKNNIVATANLLEACRKSSVKKIVFASTSAVYGNADTIPTPENSEIRPVSVYGATKAACESLIRSYHETYGMDAIIVRYANVFGPGSLHGVMHDFTKKLLTDPNSLEILGDGLQSKSYIYIDDAIDATLIASRSGGWEIYNIGSNECTTVRQIANLISSQLGATPHMNFLGGECGWTGDIPRCQLDTSKIKGLGWKQMTGLEEGLRKYVDWVKKNA